METESPQRTLVMDNARFHHGEAVEQWAENNHIRLQFLPPYTPQLNPIENLFSVIKSNVRNHRPRPTTFLELSEAIISAVSAISLKSFEDYYRHMRLWVQKGQNREAFD